MLLLDPLPHLGAIRHLHLNLQFLISLLAQHALKDVLA